MEVFSVNDDNLNEKSTGRAFQNNYPFPTSFFPKPNYSNFRGTNNNNIVNEKVPRYIVYPAYTPNDSNIDQAKRGYDKVFATGMHDVQ